MATKKKTVPGQTVKKAAINPENNITVMQKKQQAALNNARKQSKDAK